MKHKFARNLSFTAAQLLVNQLSGLIIFYLLSRGLAKEDFGELNWCLAVLLTCFTILSFGIDQMLIKKVAEGKEANLFLSLYVFHVLATGLLFYGLLVLCSFCFPTFFHDHPILLLLGFGKLLFFLSSPYKQIANGLEQFKLLMYMSVGANLFKGIGLLALSLINKFSILNIIAVFVLGDLVEFMASFYCIFIRLKIRHLFRQLHIPKYLEMVRESLPLLGVVLFSSALARLDWIFIGLFTSTSRLAEYSFAYKVFEFSTFPLLMIAPLLIPWFSKLFSQNQRVEPASYLALLLRFEIIIASAVALALNILWVPLIDPLTNGKYGSVNRDTLFILTLCMPLLYLNNFLWTIHFSKGQLRTILNVFAITFIINLVGDLVLIPAFQNEGAAVAYFLAMLGQSILYLAKTNKNLMIRWQPLFACVIFALLSGIASTKILSNTWLALSLALSMYLLMLSISTQFRLSDWKYLKKVANF